MTSSVSSRDSGEEVRSLSSPMSESVLLSSLILMTTPWSHGPRRALGQRPLGRPAPESEQGHGTGTGTGGIPVQDREGQLRERRRRNLKRAEPAPNDSLTSERQSLWGGGGS